MSANNHTEAMNSEPEGDNSDNGASLPQSGNLGQTTSEVEKIVAEAKSENGWRTLFSRVHKELDRQRAELVRQDGERKTQEMQVLTEARLKALREQCLHALIHRGGELRQETAQAIVKRYTELEKMLWPRLAVLQEYIERQRDTFSNEDMKERLGDRRNRLVDKRLDGLGDLVDRLSRSFGEFIETAFEMQSQPMADHVDELT